VRLLDRLDLRRAGVVEQGGGDDEHRQVDQPRGPHRDDDVHALEAQEALALLLTLGPYAVLGQRRVQVDDVRHDGRAEDAHGEQDAVGAVEVRDQAAQQRAAVDVDLGEVVQEAEADDAEQRGDGDLEPAVALGLQVQDAERDDGGDQAGGERRDAEQQVERDRRADELGEVGGDGDDLGLDPEAEGHGPLEVLAAQLGQVAAGGDADLRRQVLHEHRHEVRGDDDPRQQEAVLRAAGDVRREVARVDVGDRGDEGRAEHEHRAARAAALLRVDTPGGGGRENVLAGGHPGAA
jgi:hypothetical protein